VLARSAGAAVPVMPLSRSGRVVSDQGRQRHRQTRIRQSRFPGSRRRRPALQRRRYTSQTQVTDPGHRPGHRPRP